MIPAIAILAHEDLDRVSQLAQFLSKAGLHICIHIDGSVPAEDFNAFKSSLSDQSDILWAKRTVCEWGRFSLVEATLEMSAEILEKWPDAEHVMLISGDCLPTRTPAELIAFLRLNPDVDFIESVSIGDDNWITGGLGIERFTLTFPFSWKRQRWLFDIWVEVQRKLRIKRRTPNGLRPYIGSQWWCLSRKTIQSILTDPSRPAFDAYFNKCWIPDESYFQTLARHHARKIESRALLFSKFDHQGKPTAFYDDSADVIASIDAFFVRKIWPGATGLYERFLNPLSGRVANDVPTATFAQIDKAASRRKTGRSGLYMHGRAPSQWHKAHSPTAAPYDVYTGFNSVFLNFDDWQENQTGIRPHGRLFAATGVHFVNEQLIGVGGMSGSAIIRDLAPENFLCNLVWNTRATRLKFHYELPDLPKIARFLHTDPNSNLHFIRHGWVLDLIKRDVTNVDFLRAEATALIEQERRIITALKQPKTKCSYNIWTLGEVLSNPAPALSATLGSADAKSPLGLPELADAAQLSDFAQGLKNIGVDIDLALLEPSTSEVATKISVQAQR